MRNSNNSRVILILQNKQCYTTLNVLLRVALKELAQPDFLTSTLIAIFLKCLLTSEIKDNFYIANVLVNMDKRIILLPIKLASTMRKVRIFLSILFYIVQTKKNQPKLEVCRLIWALSWWRKLRLALTDACFKTSWHLQAKPEPGDAAVECLRIAVQNYVPKLISHVLCQIPKISGTDDDRDYFGGVTQS